VLGLLLGEDRSHRVGLFFQLGFAPPARQAPESSNRSLGL
jgi:hypothetical protein